MNVICWSDDPKFYEILTGGSEFVDQPYVKMNCQDNIHKLIQHFEIPKTDCSLGEFYIKQDDKFYIVLFTDTIKDGVKFIKEARFKLT